MSPRIQSLCVDLTTSDQTYLKTVAQFSTQHLGSLLRRSGETYAEHCIEVANVLREASTDASLLAVALLHDLPVHPDGKDLLQHAPLTDEEKSLVTQMYTLRRLHITENTKDLDTVIDAFLEQPELLPLRMAHRLNDVRNIQRFSSRLQKDIAKETLHMYSAIAGRLGMQRWRTEMEDIAFPVEQPKIAKKLIQQFEASAMLDATCLHQARTYLEKECKKRTLHVHIENRIKGLFSSYRKMVLKQRTFSELTDRLALRVIVDSTEDCYLALGVVHAVMHPIPGKLKDYIGAPKENGYQSIHTVVYPLPGVSEQPIEIQIRTSAMHEACEFGPASHGQYKRSAYALSSKPSRVNLFRNLDSLHAEARDPSQFEEALRNYFREDHIAIFDEGNNLYHLKQPATALDFACIAHPKKCYRTKGVRINGRKRPLSTQLHDGDAVEVQFGRVSSVKKEWLEACSHALTEKKLREALRKQGVATHL